MVNIDSDIENADWTKRTWDLQIDSLDELFRYLAGPGEPIEIGHRRLTNFLMLPSAQAMPESLREEVIEWSNANRVGSVKKHGDPDTDPDYFRKHPNAKRRRLKVPEVRVRRDVEVGGFPTNFVHPKTGEEMRQTEVGQTYERLFAIKAADAIGKKLRVKGYEQVTSSGQGSNTPIDISFGPQVKGKKHYTGEMKSLNIAGEAKATIHADQMQRKINAAAKTKALPLTIVQVVDQDKRRVLVYYSTSFTSMRTRAGDKRLPSGARSRDKKAFRTPDFEYTYSDTDFLRAQSDSGWWNLEEKRHTTPEEKKRMAVLRRVKKTPDIDEPDNGDVVIEVIDGVPDMHIVGRDIYNFEGQEERLIQQAQDALDEDEEPYEIEKHGNKNHPLYRQLWHPGPGKATAADFHRNFESAFQGSPYKNHVSHYSVEEIEAKGVTPVTINDGKTGLLVVDHGDGRIEASALYNQSDIKGSGIELLRYSIREHGVNYVEAYGPFLNHLYESLGFVVSQEFPFDPSQAAKDWDYTKFDHPNYYLMDLEVSVNKSEALVDLLLSDPDEARRQTESKAGKVKGDADAQWSAALAVLGVSTPEIGKKDDLRAMRAELERKFGLPPR